MAIYKNIDGTTKPSFRLGPKGVTLLVSEVKKDKTSQETMLRLAVQEKGKDPRLLLYQEDVVIPNSFVERIDQNEEKTETTFYMRDGSHITVNTRNVGVKGPAGAVANNLASFKDSTGQEIQDSGVGVENQIVLDSNGNGSSTKVPTIEAVVNYVGSISDLLGNRVEGYDGFSNTILPN